MESCYGPSSWTVRTFSGFGLGLAMRQHSLLFSCTQSRWEWFIYRCMFSVLTFLLPFLLQSEYLTRSTRPGEGCLPPSRSWIYVLLLISNKTATHEDKKRGKTEAYWVTTNICRHIMPLYSKKAYFFTEGIRCHFSYKIKKASIKVRIYDCLRAHIGGMRNWLLVINDPFSSLFVYRDSLRPGSKYGSHEWSRLFLRWF